MIEVRSVAGEHRFVLRWIVESRQRRSDGVLVGYEPQTFAGGGWFAGAGMLPRRFRRPARSDAPGRNASELPDDRQEASRVFGGRLLPCCRSGVSDASIRRWEPSRSARPAHTRDGYLSPRDSFGSTGPYTSDAGADCTPANACPSPGAGVCRRASRAPAHRALRWRGRPAQSAACPQQQHSSEAAAALLRRWRRRRGAYFCSERRLVCRPPGNEYSRGWGSRDAIPTAVPGRRCGTQQR